MAKESTMNDFFRNNNQLNNIESLSNKSTDVKSSTSLPKGTVQSKVYGDYYDVSDTIDTAGASDPNDPDSAVYNRERIFEVVERNAERLLVKNDGTDTIYTVVTHIGGASFSKEVPIYTGESKIYYNVYEIRIRSPTLSNAYRVMEYELNPTSISPTDIDTLVQQMVTNVSMMEFWSDIDDIITLTTATANVALPDIVIANIPANTTIIKANGMIKMRALNNTSQAANAINGASVINVKKAATAWGASVALINIVDNAWYTEASTKEGGMLVEGDNNVIAEVDANGIYNLRFNGNVFVDGNNLELIDVMVGLKIYFIPT